MSRRQRPSVGFDRASAESFMRLALQEAEKGLGRTSPNPAVGAIVVREGRVVARGHHARAGGPHAEVVALRAAGASARGADLYTTLEPCDHWGKTPPCSIAVLEAGIRRVFVGSRDPNPVVNGRGIGRLRRAGVPVVLGVLEDACDALNAHWFHYIRTARPFVTIKVALTLDGRIATRTGDARWVTGEEARAEVHRMRDQSDAILVGAGTALADDPQLTTRLPGRRGHDPVRIILDSGRRPLPRGLKLFTGRSASPTLLATARPRVRAPAGVEVLRVRAAVPRRVGAARSETRWIDLEDLLAQLGRRGITHLLVEGGAATHRSFLAAGLVDRVVAFVAPKILGGGHAWLDGPGPERMQDALTLEGVEVRRVGQDVMVVGRVGPRRPRRRSTHSNPRIGLANLAHCG